MAASGQAILSGVLPIADAAAELVEATVRAHALFVFQVAYSVLRNHHDAEDATQETFLRVHRHRRQLAEVRNPRAWLARIAWRVAVDRRRSGREVSLEEAAEAVRERCVTGCGPEDIAAGQEMSALLEQLVTTLPRRLREALTLATIEEMATSDIAEVLGIPEASVRSRVFRARQLLREKLAARLGGRYGREEA